MKNKLVGILVVTAMLFASCDNSMKGKNTNSSGDIAVYVEESYKPLFETSIYTFEAQYPLSNIRQSYLSETEVIEAFMTGKTSTICITRDFTDAEKKALREKSNVEVRSYKLAIDAIALIIHPENTDTLFTVDRIKAILKGQDTLWTGSNRKINVVFDKPNSANFHYLKHLADVETLPSNVYAVNSNEEVINFVKDNRNAIGVIGVNWISDDDDPATLNFKDGIKVVEVSKGENQEYFKPFQAYIYDEYHKQAGYPLVREAWLITKGGRMTLDGGFTNFMIGEKGQLIVHKSALIPAKMIGRVVNVVGQ